MDSAPQSHRGCRSPDPLHQISCSVFILVALSWTIRATPTDIGNLISGSSAFSKSSLNIWKFLVHVLLKPHFENLSVRFQAKPVNITVIQVYAPTTNAEEAEVELFYEDLEGLLEGTPPPKKMSFSSEGFSSVQSLSRVRLFADREACCAVVHGVAKS